MTEIRKKYTLGKIKQLIDLNGDSVNFDLTFTVTCQNNVPFDLLVVDQQTLDNTPELKYKEVKGSLSGNIVADKNMYQNYFLILKSQTPCEVEVFLVKKDLPETPMGPGDMGPGVMGSHPNGPHPNEMRLGNYPGMKSSQQSTGQEDSAINWKVVGIVVGVVGGLLLLYYMYSKSNTTTSKTRLSFPTIKATQQKQHMRPLTRPPGQSHSSHNSNRSDMSDASSEVSSVAGKSPGKTFNLLDRINKINIK